MSQLSDDDLRAAVLAEMADPVIVVTGALELVWANAAAERRFGWSLQELQGHQLIGMVHPDDHETALLSMASVLTKEVGTLVEIRIKDRTGEYSWFEIRGRAWVEGPEPGTVVLNLRPTTERRRWELAAGDSHLLAVILDAAPVVLLSLHRDGRIASANRAVTRALHRPVEGLLGVPLVDLVHPDDRAQLAEELTRLAGSDSSATFEARLVAADGTLVPMRFTAVDLLSDRLVRAVIVAASDITSLVEARSALHHLANHDDLTGLPNRSNLRERLQGLLSGDAVPSSTLLFADVDGLKPVNDHHGHQAGDAALSEIARRLRSVTRDQDYVARLSGDEFVMLVASTDESVIRDVQARIAEVMEVPIALPDGTKVTMSLSTGAAPATDASISAEELLAAADAAMYVAKRKRAAGT